MNLFGAIEAGGTKFVVAVGTGPDDLLSAEIPTTSPAATVAEAVAWLSSRSAGCLSAVGIGAFGPVDLNAGSPSYGFITSTPKSAWRNFNLAGAVRDGLGVPTPITTDVNAAVLGEARWGAARDVSHCLYLTVGTGIGGGAILDGRVLHGLTHPEMGHVRIPRDPADAFAGVCPYHRDCLEGLASGPAIEARWGVRGENLPPDHPAWALEARYLAYAIANYVCTLSPERILLGGGVMRQGCLYPAIRTELERVLAGYLEKIPAVVPPQLGERAGVLGALALAYLSVSFALPAGPS